jgi:alkylation response protein AidB-like acyl-CoA dehydrogenase
MDETLGHVSQRKLFGGVLSDLQLVQGKLSDMALATIAVRCWFIAPLGPKTVLPTELLAKRLWPNYKPLNRRS